MPQTQICTQALRRLANIYIYICISLPYFMFGRALSWGSAFAVCIVHCSLVYQFEHSGKVRRAWFKFGFENFYSSLLSGSASFLCAALMSPQRTKQYCPQIEYIYIYIYISNMSSAYCQVTTNQKAVLGGHDFSIMPSYGVLQGHDG